VLLRKNSIAYRRIEALILIPTPDAADAALLHQHDCQPFVGIKGDVK
jgi:hypothetical protein